MKCEMCDKEIEGKIYSCDTSFSVKKRKYRICKGCFWKIMRKQMKWIFETIEDSFKKEE